MTRLFQSTQAETAFDAMFRGDGAWIEAQRREAEAKGAVSLLVLDEIQKIEASSEYIKKLWDESIDSSKR